MEMGHRRQIQAQRGLDEFHFDYCFPGDEFGCKLSVLIGVEKYTGMKMAAVVPTKGGTGAFAARKAMELVNECGDRELNVIVKSDQEPAIKFLMSDISRMRTSGKTLLEESPKLGEQWSGRKGHSNLRRFHKKSQKPT